MVYLNLTLKPAQLPSLAGTPDSVPAPPRLGALSSVVPGEGYAAGMANTGSSSLLQERMFSMRDNNQF
jgi:hypothetical protein